MANISKFIQLINKKDYETKELLAEFAKEFLKTDYYAFLFALIETKKKILVNNSYGLSAEQRLEHIRALDMLLKEIKDFARYNRKGDERLEFEEYDDFFIEE